MKAKVLLEGVRALERGARVDAAVRDGIEEQLRHPREGEVVRLVETVTRKAEVRVCYWPELDESGCEKGERSRSEVIFLEGAGWKGLRHQVTGAVELAMRCFEDGARPRVKSIEVRVES